MPKAKKEPAQESQPASAPAPEEMEGEEEQN